VVLLLDLVAAVCEGMAGALWQRQLMHNCWRCNSKSAHGCAGRWLRAACLRKVQHTVRDAEGCGREDVWLLGKPPMASDWSQAQIAIVCQRAAFCLNVLCTMGRANSRLLRAVSAI
jgi:hypothetical protein